MTGPESAPERGTPPSTLLELLDAASAQRILRGAPSELGVADHLPYPFFAIVGQSEMLTALLLSVINPAVGGVLLIGPRGIGKTTAVRSLTDLLPYNAVSLCDAGCLPEDVEGPGVCASCAAKLARNEPISRQEPVKLVELPLNARLEDVVGGVNERIAVQQGRIRLEPGILSRADRNVLYIDEVNLLDDHVVDAILDAAAQGSYTVRRGAMSGTFNARFVLIGSMNPEEGRLRPQIMDRFGLRVPVQGLRTHEERREIYRRVRRYQENRQRFLAEWAELTEAGHEEVVLARELLRETKLSDEAVEVGLTLVQELNIDSHRAEYAMFEAARAHAAADGRDLATAHDIRRIAPMALRQRRSAFMDAYFAEQDAEDRAILDLVDHLTDDVS